MPSSASSHAARSGDVAGVLRLLAWLILAVVLMVLDHRGGWLHGVRAKAEIAIQPLWWLAGAPARIGNAVYESAATRSRLLRENHTLRQALLITAARNARLRTVAVENARLRGLLDSAARGQLDAQLAGVIDIDLDPTRQRLILDAGSRAGVRPGQAVIDAGGLMGQVISTTPSTATVLLVTDPDHAVPVMVARSGARLIVYGSGRSDALRLANVPLSTDIHEGDVLLTSGLGGHFPPGFAVGRVGVLRVDDSRAFLEADVKPAAQLDRGRDVLLLRGYKPAVARPPAAVSPAGVAASSSAAGSEKPAKQAPVKQAAAEPQP